MPVIAKEKIKQRLFEFLSSSETLLDAEGFPAMTRESARRTLRDLIPAVVEVKNVCALDRTVVAAAPHVSYDGWTEYYCNRTAHQLKTGRVIARHFRDDNEFDIPVSIGRHVHVNRPTESNGPRGHERETARAKEAYGKYIAGLKEAGGGKLPLDLLIEFHGHRNHEAIEIATCGIDKTFAGLIHEFYQDYRKQNEALPRLLIEPLHQLRFNAQAAKRCGSLQQTVARAVLHIELPRNMRQTEEQRKEGWNTLKPVLSFVIDQLRA